MENQNSFASKVSTEFSASAKDSESSGSYNSSIAYLKALIIALVLLSHTVVYHSIYAPKEPYTSLTDNFSWIIIPIVDGSRSFFLTLLQQFNTGFIMALMYFLSGLFVWKSLQKKGRAVYFRDRLIRLGIPLLAMAFIVPLTYIPVHMMVEKRIGILDYWGGIFTMGRFVTGPGWFISMLLLFDIFVILFSLIPWKKNIKEKSHNFMRSPGLSCLMHILITSVLYVPMTIPFPGMHISAFGPFAVQTNRSLLYLFYFIAGVYTGAYGIDRTFLADGKRFLSKWYIWTIAAGILYAFRMYITFADIKVPKNLEGIAYIFYGFTYALLCAVSSLAFLAIFLRFVRNRRKILDSFYSNSYGVYIFHFPVICWLEYSLLRTILPPVPKDAIVLAGAVLVCWGLTTLIRKIPGVSRVI